MKTIMTLLTYTLAAMSGICFVSGVAVLAGKPILQEN